MRMHVFSRFAIALVILLQAYEACEETSDFERIPDVFEGCFLLSKHKATWQEAAKSCQKLGGQLIHIYHKDYMTVAVSSLNKTTEHTVWIGMQKTDQDWTWSVDDSSIGNTAWAAAQPSSTASNQCVMMSSKEQFKWTSEACYIDKAGYICTHRNGTEGCLRNGGQFMFASSVSDLCYVVYQNPVSWYTARQKCGQESAPLAKVNSISVFELLESQLKKAHDRIKPDIDGYWIGLRNSVWKWDSGAEVVENFWAQGSPSNSFNCGAVRSKGNSIGWDAYDCPNKFHYICDAPKTTPGTTLDPKVKKPSGGGPSPALTGGLVVLCLVLLLILGAVVVLFFMYKRRGSQLRARARAAAAALRNAPPREKTHNGDPSNLFFVQNNGAAAYEGNFNDIEHAEPTSDKARIVEHPQSMAISETQQNSCYTSIEEGTSDSPGTDLKDSKTKSLEDLDTKINTVPEIHIENPGASSTEPDATDSCQTEELNEQQGQAVVPAIVQNEYSVEEDYPIITPEAKPQPPLSPTSDNDNLKNITNNETEESTDLPQASSNPSSSTESKFDDLVDAQSNSNTQLNVEPDSKNLLTVSDKLDMEEFDENELLSPRFKDDLVPHTSRSDDLGLMELDPSDIMTPRGMPMGKTLSPSKNNDDFIDL